MQKQLTRKPKLSTQLIHPLCKLHFNNIRKRVDTKQNVFNTEVHTIYYNQFF